MTELEPALPVPFLDLETAHKQEGRKISRVTVRFSVARERSFEPCQAFPMGDLLGYEIKIPHEEAAITLEKKLKADSPILKVDTYWVDNPSIMIIVNTTKWKESVLPSQEQIDEINRQLVAIGFDGENFPLLLAPGRSQPLLMAKDQHVYMKSLYGTPSISVFAV